MDKQPIWFDSGVPLGLNQGIEFLLTPSNAKCRIYIPDDCAPLARMAPGQIMASVPVHCLESILELLVDIRSIGALLKAQEEANDPAITSSPERAAKAFSRWEQDGSVGLLETCYEVLYDGFKRPLEWIRDEFAHYWLRTLPPFIEENQSIGKLGQFLDDVQAQWSLDGQTWQRLRLRVIELSASTPDPDELLTANDWNRFDIARESDLTLHLMSRARAAFSARDHRTAVITAITAVEREVLRFIRTQLQDRRVKLGDKALSDLGRQTGIKVLLETLVSSLGEAAHIRDISASVRSVLKANTARNKLIHGAQRDLPRDEARQHLESCEALLEKILPNDVRLRRAGWIPWD